MKQIKRFLKKNNTMTIIISAFIQQNQIRILSGSKEVFINIKNLSSLFQDNEKKKQQETQEEKEKEKCMRRRN